MWRISLCLLCYHQWLGVGEGWKIIICHPIQSSLIRSLLFTLCLLNDCAWLKEASKWSMVLILCMKHGSYSLGLDAHFYHLGSKQVVLWVFQGNRRYKASSRDVFLMHEVGLRCEGGPSLLLLPHQLLLTCPSDFPSSHIHCSNHREPWFLFPSYFIIQVINVLENS